MSLIKRKNNELSPMRSLLTDVLDVDRFFGNDPFFKELKQVPAANIREKEQGFEITLAAPGLDKKDFKIEVDNNILTISAERKQEKQETKGNYTRQEFSYDAFARSFELPTTVNADAIDAQYNDGILTLSLPKKEEAKRKAPKEIAVA